MSVYSNRNKRWRYDFTKKGIRYTEAGFKTKKEALRAEAQRKEEILNPPEVKDAEIDTDFFELVNLRLDHIKAYNSESYYLDFRYMARKWISLWGEMACQSMTSYMLEQFVLERSKVSSYTANKEIRYLRATFNFGKKKMIINHNPADNLDFLPIDKKLRYIPTHEDVEKVIQEANLDTQDYLYTISDTMARVSEINRLKWEDVDFHNNKIVLYTRKKKGGHLTPRNVTLTKRLFNILTRRFEERDMEKPWVFWHKYFNRQTKIWQEGPYKDRKRIMRTLCKKAGVRYFRFHALRHEGASTMDNNNVPIGAIQRILGHENRITTEIYLQTIGNTEREAIETLERVRTFSHTKSHTNKKAATNIS